MCQLLVSLLKEQLKGWSAVATALKLEAAEIDSRLVKAICKCAPLRQSSEQDNAAEQITQAELSPELDLHMILQTIREHAPLLTPKDFFKPQGEELRASLCSYSDVLSLVYSLHSLTELTWQIAVMSRGNGIVGPTGIRGKATTDKEDAYEAVSRSIPDDPGLRETMLAYLAVHSHLPIPKVPISTTTMADIEPSRMRKTSEHKGGWISSKDNRPEAKVH
jgi:hypothetical protein